MTQEVDSITESEDEFWTSTVGRGKGGVGTGFAKSVVDEVGGQVESVGAGEVVRTFGKPAKQPTERLVLAVKLVEEERFKINNKINSTTALNGHKLLMLSLSTLKKNCLEYRVIKEYYYYNIMVGHQLRNNV